MCMRAKCEGMVGRRGGLGAPAGLLRGGGGGSGGLSGHIWAPSWPLAGRLWASLGRSVPIISSRKLRGLIGVLAMCLTFAPSFSLYSCRNVVGLSGVQAPCRTFVSRL